MSVIKKLAHVLMWLVAVVFPSAAYAQDACRDILENGLRNDTTSIRQRASAQAERAFYCSASASEAWDRHEKLSQSGQSASGGVSYGIFSASGGGGKSVSDSEKQAQFSSWTAKNCGDKTSSQEAQSFDYLAQSAVNAGTVGAWSKCMSDRQDLSCWTVDRSAFAQLEINWRAQSTEKPRLQNSFLAGGSSQLTPDGSKLVLPDDYPLNVGRTSVFLERKGRSAINGMINISHGGANYNCAFYVPELPDPSAPVPSPVGSKASAELLARYDNVGCSAQWPGRCKGAKDVATRPGRDICKVVISHRSGPTARAWYEDRVTRSGGPITYEADATNPPFGPGQWVHLDIAVYDIELTASGEQRQQAGCKG